ncbi:MAG: TfoX/Sxy family protein [Lewinellaceae bacterium]|nr:TfoX/Sxy family protein [Saprospiraceae bacterium]MCB9313034.1 TfoX/Sxy family protein [Lewinellaceae bacterium]HRW76123.1 TfoX/Sxy family protein [Saprospiraceae bacterium]
MACTEPFIAYLSDQLAAIEHLVIKPMFGEYGIWADGKFFALICDDRLYIKPTAAGRQYIGPVTEAPPYNGAKNYFLIDEHLDDRQWLSQLVRITLAELPPPRPKKKTKT